MAWIPGYLQAMAAYLTNPNVSGMYGMWDSNIPGNKGFIPGEGGVDLGAPVGTPVYALADGPIIGAGYWNDSGHGVVTTRIQVPGAGTQDLYYQHITLDPSITQCSGGTCPGQTVTRGQKIGTVGPYGETEMGFNAQWGTIWGTNHPGPWIPDPRPWLAGLMNGSAPLGSVNSNGTGGTDIISGGAGGTQVVGTNNLPDWAIKVGLFVFALTLTLLGIWLLFKQQIKAGANKAKNVALAVGSGGTDIAADKGAV